ncbi:hypothetical protein MMC19_003569 [Ptychographa xylographoides]|nr:hypothetical protein [Ptychographa xylographoides]
MPVDHETATNEELVTLCSSKDREIIGGAPYGNRVIKLSDKAVIKFGVGVREEEAKNLKMASILLDPTIVRVPYVYRFFTHESLSYIVMEYIKGRIIESLEDLALINKINGVVAHFAEICSSKPGPLGGGVSRGLLWNDEDVILNTIQDVEDFFNSKLREHHRKLVLQNCKLVLCHLDIAPRNILWLDDDSICFLDWATAGFYPRSFEFCAQYCILGQDGRFNQLLLEGMEKLTDEEETHIEPIGTAYTRMMRYTL